MLHNELLKELFEADQWDRLVRFEIQPQIVNLGIKNISDAVLLFKQIRHAKKEEGIFSPDFDKKMDLLIGNLNKILNEKNLPDAEKRLKELKMEFGLLDDEKLNSNDANRRNAVAQLMPMIFSPTNGDYYHAAVIYNHGNSRDDCDLAYQYASKAKDLINEHDIRSSVRLLGKKIKEEYAFVYDRYQLNQDKPQKYGSTYAGKQDDNKGWEIGKLVPPSKGYVYDRDAIDDARKELGIKSLDQQEIDWGIKPTLKPSKSKENTDEKKVEKNQSQLIICKNCGESGHFAGVCIRPSKPK
ncbi:MAG: hypothetical protein ABI370_13830 [Gammaproteobacteria bacterium]